ncbi:zinc finger protein 271-like [Stomoxys calcitrans]|uniref:zinc finger protein 271-like n=1 Tax=Stomoxys calcitrans TaxID=35570 RepID=UPI0027E2BAA4|nr:zinc finger protein 271-like [Stomoxys calcitrans]
MLNMEWERRLQYICGKCWLHIWEFHQFQESIVEVQKGLHLPIEAAKDVAEVVKIKTEMSINQLEDLEVSASTEVLMKPTALAFEIKTEEPLDLNNDYEGMSPQTQYTDEEMSSGKETTSLMNDDEPNEDYSSNDDLPLTSFGQKSLSSTESKVPATKRSVEQFDELVALWRSCLKCDICHQLMPSYSQLEEHFRNNHASESCYLMCCQLRLQTRYDIENHMHYHNAPQQLRCDACCKAFRLERYLKAHKKKIHTSKGEDKNAKPSESRSQGKYRCGKCSKAFARKKSLTQHIRNAHKPKMLECNICEKSFVRPYALREHLASHKGEKTHACSFCAETFTCRSYLRRHMRIYHAQEWNKMQSEAAQRETPKGYRIEYRGSGMVYVCIYCSEEYENPPINHINECQRDNALTEPKTGYRRETRGESIVYICIYCSKEYEKRQSMYNHLYRCQRDDVPIDPKKSYRRETRGKSMVYICIHCSKEYEKRYSIYNHIRRCQQDDRQIEPRRGYRRETRGEHKVYVCIFCSKEYDKWQSMNNHMYRLHRDEASLAKQAPKISKPPVPTMQQQTIRNRRVRKLKRITAPQTSNVANKTPDGDNLKELGKEGEEEENTLMPPMEGTEMKDDNAARTYVKTEQFSADTNALGNEEMKVNEHDVPPEFEVTTWESEEFIKSEREFI